MSSLYLVATPIGNMEDITLRGLRVLREVALIAAEDTRTARKLMFHHDVTSRVISYTEHNMQGRTPQIMQVLNGGGDVALVSEAGTPGISDPGYELVRAVIAAGHNVSPIPGPSAPVAAVVASGLPSAEFIFLGFLPRRSGERRRLFDSLRESPRTLVAFESPHRLIQTLQDMLSVLGDRRVAICRELTKLHEEIFRGHVTEALERFVEPRGEFTLVIEGAPLEAVQVSDDELRSRLRHLLESGLSARDAAAEVAKATGTPRRRVYALALEIKNTPGEKPD
ncbi:MAG: 16S rRNA (cytidine(1402)-2'-O)-methyltransferase [Dehalococcoidia bacterium]